VPFFVVLLERQRPSARVIGGLLLGFAGMALLVGPGQIGGAPVNGWGAAGLVVASLTWAIGSLYSRRAPQPSSGIQFTGMEMIAGGVLLLVVGVGHGELGRLDLAAVSTRSMLAWVYLVGCGSLLGFTAYVWLLKVVPPSRVATYAYVNPVVAVLLGFVFAGEPLGARVVIAMAVIVGAVALIITAPTAKKAAAVEPEARSAAAGAGAGAAAGE
jgi:drug/metabolite transporter (DMT)-like permease